MKILILGTGGQVGWELPRQLAGLGTLVAWDRASADFEDPMGLGMKVRAEAPQVIVNAAAYTAVDRAESEPERAFRINRDAPGALAEAARGLGASLVHYSTDYVFDGASAEPYRETDPTGPLSVYGRSKLEGEEAIRGSGCHYLIFRTSWVYASRGRNFPRTILKLASERDELRIVDDQQGAPTGARLIAGVTRLALEALAGASDGPRLFGTFHLAASGKTTWHGYARFVVEEAARLGVELRASADRILPMPARNYPQPAERPANSGLNTEKLRSRLGVELPMWQEGVREALGEIVSEAKAGSIVS
jgi:dTDP-4-dehydrorhamnose reductase